MHILGLISGTSGRVETDVQWWGEGTLVDGCEDSESEQVAIALIP